MKNVAALPSEMQKSLFDHIIIGASCLFKLLLDINVKKLQFIHKLTASDTSKTAKITKR